MQGANAPPCGVGSLLWTNAAQLMLSPFFSGIPDGPGESLTVILKMAKITRHAPDIAGRRNPMGRYLRLGSVLHEYQVTGAAHA
jgi:hypothetical protein